MTYRIFIVEDDPTIALAMQKHIESWGFDVHCAADFLRVEEEFLEFDPQLVLLDILLPFYNGYHWCQRIRAHSKVPIVFLSSAADNMNQVLAMNLGADDFIAKPFDLTVLSAKITAILRRAYDYTGITPRLSHRGAVLDPDTLALVWQKKTIPLVSRDTLMERLWETDSFVDENTLNVNVARLRKKLEAAGLSDFIVTKKGIGYGLA